MITPISIKYTANRNFGVFPNKNVDINLLHYFLVHCDLCLKLEGAIIEKSNQTTLKQLKRQIED